MGPPEKKGRPPGATPGAAADFRKQVTAQDNVALPSDQGISSCSVTPGFVWGAAPVARTYLNCGEPGVAGLCSVCDAERAHDRLADTIAGQAELLASQAGPSPFLSVSEHLRPQPRRLRCSRAELEIALEWERLPEPDPHGRWWSATIALPAPYVEAFPVWGRRDERGI